MHAHLVVHYPKAKRMISTNRSFIHIILDSSADIEGQVIRKLDATAHQLRTGDTGPGSKPLPMISEMLANPRVARYQVEKSQARLGIHASPAKGGLSVLHSLGQLVKRLREPFIIDSSLSGPIFFTLQTPFMQRLIGDAIEAWIEDDGDGPDAGRHGFVTDGDHSFFRQGTLLATCVFSNVLNAWAPVLYSWIDSMDTEHHRPHFRHIFRAVVSHAGPRFEKKFLLHVCLSAV